MLVTLDKICKSFLDEVVLRDVSFSINENERIGLLGVNGAGKSTLLNIITGILPFDSGTRTVKSSLEIGYLKQNEALNSENTLREEIEDALSEVYDVREKLLEASKRISASTPGSEEYRNLSEAYEKLTNQYDALDGYTADTRINIVLNGLGFGDFNLEQKTAHLSGGEKIRFGIAKILLHNPELLILDEPTNHLDFTMLTWLEDYLSSYKGSVLIVSHDRYFLDNVVDRIFELDGNGGIRQFEGGYTDYVEAKKRRFGEESKVITGKSEMKPAEKSTEEETQEKKTGKNWKDGQRQKVKFSFKEQREYETIDEEIAKLEEKIASLDRQIAANATNSVKLRELMEEQEKVREQLEEKEERWMYLNELAEEFGL